MAKGKSIGSIFAELSLSDKGFSKNLKAAGDKLNDFGKNSKLLKGAAVAAGAGIAALGAMITASGAILAKGSLSIFELGGRLSDVREQTGMTVKDIMLLEKAFKDGGLSSEQLGSSIAKMQKAMVGAMAGDKDPFAKLGLSAKELMALNPAQQFDEIGQALARVTNPAERNAVAMEIFGKSGFKLATVLGKGLEDAATALGKTPALMDQFAGGFDRASDLIGGLPDKSNQFFTGFGSQVVGTILPALEKINKFDFTELGKNAGRVFSIIFTGLMEGTYWDVFKIQSNQALDNLSAYFFDSFSSMVEAIAEFSSNLFGQIANEAKANWVSIKQDIGLASEQESEWLRQWSMEGNGQSFAEILDQATKRKQAQRDEENAKADQKIAELYKGLVEKVSGRTKDVIDKFAPQDITNPLALDLEEKDKKKKKEKQVTIEGIKVREDDFMRRGLGLKGSMVSTGEKTQITLLGSIKDILTRIEKENPNLKFA